jgi:hypothetical protein
VINFCWYKNISWAVMHAAVIGGGEAKISGDVALGTYH